MTLFSLYVHIFVLCALGYDLAPPALLRIDYITVGLIDHEEYKSAGEDRFIAHSSTN